MKISLLCVWLSIGLAKCWIFEYLPPAQRSRCATRYGVPGNCEQIRDCPLQLQAVKYFSPQYWPKVCGFNEFDPKVCCPDADLRPSEQACRKLQEDLQSGRLQVPTPKKTFVYTIQVFNGEEAPKASHPHMVALGYDKESSKEYEWLCGGTLISESYVLTAAHCVANLGSGSPDVVWIGVHSLDDQSAGKVIPVEEYTVHPLHSVTSHYHDIALLKVKKVVLGEDALPACLYNLMDDPYPLEVLGWGATDQDAVFKSQTLQTAELQSVPLERCNETYVSPKHFPRDLQEGIIETQICAEGTDGLADTCLGDSGGPLQTKRYTGSSTPLQSVVGVTSFGQFQFCGTVGVYTRVASYLDWIESIVWHNI